MSFWREFGRKWDQIRWKSHHFLNECPWKSHDLNLSKIHVMFQHGKQTKPGLMTWNGHGIWCGFGPNCRQFVTRNDMEFLWECISHFLQGVLLFSFFQGNFLKIYGNLRKSLSLSRIVLSIIGLLCVTGTLIDILVYKKIKPGSLPAGKGETFN